MDGLDSNDLDDGDEDSGPEKDQKDNLFSVLDLGGPKDRERQDHALSSENVSIPAVECFSCFPVPCGWTKSSLTQPHRIPW